MSIPIKSKGIVGWSCYASPMKDFYFRFPQILAERRDLWSIADPLFPNNIFLVLPMSHGNFRSVDFKSLFVVRSELE